MEVGTVSFSFFLIRWAVYRFQLPRPVGKFCRYAHNDSELQSIRSFNGRGRACQPHQVRDMGQADSVAVPKSGPYSH